MSKATRKKSKSTRKSLLIGTTVLKKNWMSWSSINLRIISPRSFRTNRNSIVCALRRRTLTKRSRKLLRMSARQKMRLPSKPTKTTLKSLRRRRPSTRLRSIQNSTFNTRSAQSWARNLAATVCTRRRSLRCRTRSTCWGSKSTRNLSSRRPLEAIWVPSSPSSNRSPRNAIKRKTEKETSLKPKNCGFRTCANQPKKSTKISRNSLLTMTSTVTTCQIWSKRRSSKNTKRLKRRCPWKTPPDSSSANGTGSKRLASLWLRRRRVARARKERKSDHDFNYAT